MIDLDELTKEITSGRFCATAEHLQGACDCQDIAAYVRNRVEPYKKSYDQIHALFRVMAWTKPQIETAQELAVLVEQLKQDNKQMREAVQAVLETWKRAGPQGSGQMEKFDHCIRLCEMALEPEQRSG